MVHITTPADEFGPFSPILPVPVDVPTGWECPRCQRVYSPQTGQCVPCSPPPQTFTGPLPRRRESYTFGGFPLFNAPAAEAERPRAPMCRCSLTPCPPPAEGGMCGCEEPDDARQAVTPPASLASDPNGVRQVRLAGEWAEIFTGMQARFLDETRVWVDVEFRPAPADGQADD